MPVTVGMKRVDRYGLGMSFDAHLYCLTHRGIPGDVAFYRKACLGARNVLELGCGEGRVAVPIAEDGARVWGLESHPGMRNRAQRKRDEMSVQLRERLHIIDASMAAFSFPHLFDRIIVPFTGLFCLNPEARRTCLEAVRRHLAPGGEFVFDVYPIDLIDTEDEFEEDEFWLMSIADEGECIEVFQKDVYRPRNRVIEVTYRNVLISQSGEQSESEYTLVHHYVPTKDWPQLLTAAGFAVSECYGDFNGSPYSDESERLIIIAQ